MPSGAPALPLTALIHERLIRGVLGSPLSPGLLVSGYRPTDRSEGRAHGSNTSSTPLYLSRFPLEIAAIPCGADNPYGHPIPETLDSLHRVGARVFRNDEDGDVIVTIKDGKVDVAVTRPGAAL